MRVMKRARIKGSTVDEPKEGSTPELARGRPLPAIHRALEFSSLKLYRAGLRVGTVWVSLSLQLA